MRGVIAIVCASLGGACGGTGADVEVRSPDVAIDTVELFVSPGPCLDQGGHPCASGIAWATDMQDAPDGTIFLLFDTATFTTNVAGGVARFRLEAAPGHTSVGRVAAVGLSNGMPVATGHLDSALTIPTDHPEIWQLALTPAALVADTDPDAAPAATDPQKAVKLWTSPARAAGLTDCAMLQHWNGMSWDREFYVPANDRDCDGETVECDPYWFDFNLDGKPTTCLDTGGPQDNGSCTIGTALCADGENANGTCRQSAQPETCFPDAVCGSCTTTPTVSTDCVSMLMASSFDMSSGSAAPMLPAADCTFTPDVTDMGPCITGNSDVLTLPSMGANCVTAELHDVAVPLGPAISSLGTTGIGVMLTPIADSGSGSGGSGSGAPGAACDITITWTLGTATITASSPYLLDVGYDNGKHIVVPLQLRFGMAVACVPTTPPQCELLGPMDDQMFNCTNP